MTGGDAAAPFLPPAYRLVRRGQVSSTNDEARRLAEAGAEEGTLVWADEQRAGRGRRGRSWASPPGNLYMTLVLRPDCPPGEAAQLGFVAALAIADTIGAAAPPQTALRLKWPNDVLANERKIAGILIEAEPAFLLLGVGINAVSFPAETSYPATSLVAEGANPEEAAPARLLERFARAFNAWAARWVEEGFAPIRRQWLAFGPRVGDKLRLGAEPDGRLIAFRDLDDTGALLAEGEGGEPVVIRAGDIFPVAA